METSPKDEEPKASRTSPAVGTDQEANAQLAGPAISPVRRGIRGFFFYALGAGLLRALGRAAWWIIGGRTVHELQTAGKGLRLRTERSILGRTIRVSERRHRLSDIDSVIVGQGFRGWPLWAGAICFATGLLVGGSWIGEAARTGETYILFAGAAVLLVGAGADFLINLWHRQGKGHATLSVRTWDGRTIGLGELSKSDAETFVDHLGLPL